MSDFTYFPCLILSDFALPQPLQKSDIIYGRSLTLLGSTQQISSQMQRNCKTVWKNFLDWKGGYGFKFRLSLLGMQVFDFWYIVGNFAT